MTSGPQRLVVATGAGQLEVEVAGPDGAPAVLFHVGTPSGGRLREDIWGWFDDDVAFVRGWDVPLDEIEVPVAIWQGSEDRMVPSSHGEWLAAHVAGAQPRLLEGEGHLSIVVGRYGRLLDELLAAGGRAGEA
jgi:hypothetical protein